MTDDEFRQWLTCFHTQFNLIIQELRGVKSTMSANTDALTTAVQAVTALVSNLKGQITTLQDQIKAQAGDENVVVAETKALNDLVNPVPPPPA